MRNQERSDLTMLRTITGGVDTHLDVHVAAALNEHGTLLGVESFETTIAGYRKLLEWLRGFGPVAVVGVEGTGSYGAGLTRHLLAEEIAVVEVDRPNRQRRRRKGKSDPQDAISAARAAHSGDAEGLAKSRDGNVESMRTLRIARVSARKARTQALNQMRGIVSTGPESIRDELRGLSVFNLLDRASSYRPGSKRDVVSLTKFTLRTLARRALSLQEEIDDIDTIMKDLVEETAPELVAQLGIGTESASALLIAAGDNTERLHHESAFAHLCGSAPIDASSGKHERHRLNRGGDRQANSALWHIVLTRMVYDPRTTEYIERRTKEGLTKREAVRCLKRYVAREVYALLPRSEVALDSP
jgi:transposase